MTPEELKQIRERCEAATHDFRNSCAWERYVGASTEWRCGGPPAASLEQAKVDAAFIHHARTDVPALLAEVERLREEQSKAREGRERYIKYLDDRHTDHLKRLVALDQENVRLANESEDARAEVERLRAACVGSDLAEHYYRRGAEAMREACARVADAHCVPGTRDVIRALPIPEEP